MSFECLLVTDDARTHFMYIVKHLRVSSAAPVVAVAALNRSYETRLDVQIRCDIDSPDYLSLSRASQHSDTLICNRTSGLVGSCAYSACNKSGADIGSWLNSERMSIKSLNDFCTVFHALSHGIGGNGSFF